MSESMDSPPRPLSKRVEEVLSSLGLEDTKVNFAQFTLYLGNPALWTSIPKAVTFEEYIQTKYARDPELVGAVLAASDQAFVDAFNTFAEEINGEIAQGVTTQEQADKIMSLVQNAMAFIKEYYAKMPN